MQFLEIVQDLAIEEDYDQPQTNAEGNALATATDTKVIQMSNAVNRAYRHIWTKLLQTNEYAEVDGLTFTTVQNQENYPMPTTTVNGQTVQIESVDQLRTGADPPLIIDPWPEYERQYRGNENIFFTFRGYPFRASIYQRQIWLFPLPPEPFTMYVRGKLPFAKLVNDTDVPLFHPDVHHCLFEWALYFLQVYEGNPAKADQLSIATASLDEAKLVCGRNHFETPPRLRTEDEIYEMDAYRRNNLYY